MVDNRTISFDEAFEGWLGEPNGGDKNESASIHHSNSSGANSRRTDDLARRQRPYNPPLAGRRAPEDEDDGRDTYGQWLREH